VTLTQGMILFLGLPHCFGLLVPYYCSYLFQKISIQKVLLPKGQAWWCCYCAQTGIVETLLPFSMALVLNGEDNVDLALDGEQGVC